MFNFNTQPKQYKLNGEITVPGDKSIAHRAIMFATLAKGVTQISNFTFSDDLAVTTKVFQSLGAKIHTEPSTKDMIIKGTNHNLKPLENPIQVGNVGELTSLLMGILATVPYEYVIDGGDFLKHRSLHKLVTLLREMGAHYEMLSDEYLPVEVQGSTNLKGIVYQQDIASAQIKSSLIFSGLYANSETTVVRKIPTRSHTEILANYFGADIELSRDYIKIHPENTHLTGQNIIIPGDFSSASFYIVGALLTPGSNITLRKVGLNPTRTGLLEVIRQMGGNISIDNVRTDTVETFGDISVTCKKLHGTKISAEQVPFIIDEIPVIALMASQASGRTVIEEVHDVYLQISERVRIMRTELAKLGIVMQINENSIVIEGNQKVKVKDDVDSHNDHRIAMMLCIASNLTKTPFQIKNIEAIDASYPNFIADLKKLIY